MGVKKLVFLTTQCFSIRRGGGQTEDIWQTDVTLQKKIIRNVLNPQGENRSLLPFLRTPLKERLGMADTCKIEFEF